MRIYGRLRFGNWWLLAAATVAVGVLSAVFYGLIGPTEAAINTIVVSNNEQNIEMEQSDQDKVIYRTSVVTVRDASAGGGYVLMANLNNNLAGAKVELSSAESAVCASDNPCVLTASPIVIFTTLNNDATGADGDTVTFDVKITVLAGAQNGRYTMDIVYQEMANNRWVKAAANNAAAVNSISGNSRNNVAVDLDAHMIPVVNKDELGNYPAAWCDYDTKQWCNAVTVKPEALAAYQAAPTGMPIAEEDILGYFVYIPRYRYQVMRYDAKNNNSQYRTKTLFNIAFEKATDAKSVPTAYTGAGDYQTNVGADRAWATHPAFTVGAKELNGFWYGKFESSRSDDYYCYKDGCGGSEAVGIGVPLNSATLYATVKPNKSPALYQRAAYQYLSAEYVKIAHNLAVFNTHMSNNNHWGATAYLATSAYGAGSAASAANLYYNSSTISSNRVCAVDTVNATTTGCLFVTGAGPDEVLKTYETAIGQQASTTGNIYGVYDMAGGAWEYQMAVYANPTGIPMSGRSGEVNSGFTVDGQAIGKCYDNTDVNNVADCVVTDPLAMPTGEGILQRYDVSIFTDTEYKAGSGSLYGFHLNNNFCTWETCGGQALMETKTAQTVNNYNQSWGGGYSYFVVSRDAWFIRGGDASYSTPAKLFSHTYESGGASSNGWRVVLGDY
jgi:hypothetical protein